MTFPRPSRNSLRADGVRLRVVWPGHVWRSWKERWFVLDGHLLKYYKGSGADGTSVDTTGELGWWWGSATIAFVGGSLDGGRGGQNMLEPAAYGAAVSFGPHTRNFRDEVARLLAADAAVVVADGPGLTAFVARCLTEPAWAEALGRRGAALVASQRGGTAATARLVLEQVFGKPPVADLRPHGP
jgi:hypothetical protein